jgi:hypothetical protein
MSLQATDMQTKGYTDEKPCLPPQVSWTANRIGQERQTGCVGNGTVAVATLLQFFLIRGFQWLSDSSGVM